MLTVYAIRHHVFGLCRLWTVKRRDFAEVSGIRLPKISVIVPMHNEEKVAEDVLEALVDSDYDATCLEILAVDDRSQDKTGSILDELARKHAIIRAVHRTSGNGGKAGALESVRRQATGEILVLFDADYIPGRGLLKMLVAPFCDPEIGAVMGRVVPHNSGQGLLAGLLSLERAAGYQVDQQARFLLGLCPQFGGTVGAVRAAALEDVNGWNPHSLTEDTDLTCELLLRGWQIAYVNRAECYEEVPHSWAVRSRQLERWVMGHTECLHRFLPRILGSSSLGFLRKLDLVLMLGCYWTAPVLVIGWLASLVLLCLPNAQLPVAFWIGLLFMGCQIFGNQATFFELGTAALIDGTPNLALLMPLAIFDFFASTATVCAALLKLYSRKLLRKDNGHWHKTSRARANGNGDLHKMLKNGNGGSHLRSRTGAPRFLPSGGR